MKINASRKDTGFGTVHIIIILIVVVLVAGVGLLVWQRRSPKQAGTTTQIYSFQACVDAGNPVMESYPEQCSANGKTFTNPNQKVDPGESQRADEISKWSLYTSSSATYTIRIPDGWKLVHVSDSNTENIYGMNSNESLAYKAGQPGRVDEVQGGWDGAMPFSLIVPGAYYDQIVKQGEKQGTIKTNGGLVADKYVYMQTTEPEEFGFSKGSTVYNYYFGEDGKYIQVQHVVAAGEVDQAELVEKVIKTLQVQ
jgi:hypothetical protein